MLGTCQTGGRPGIGYVRRFETLRWPYEKADRLRDEVTRMTGRILVLKQENDEIRKKLEGQG
jgi:hypothetical protein